MTSSQLAAGPVKQSNDILLSLVALEGTASHPYIAPLLNGPTQDNLMGGAANIADAVYFLCLLHGRHPGVVDHAANHTADNVARKWLVQAADGFAAERTFLTQVSVVAGPPPSTPGHAECDTTVQGQRHALEMLAQSDRRGCAMGAAMALVLDWLSIRRVLDMVSLRLGLEPRPTLLPGRAATLEVADALGVDYLVDRAMSFGARQLLSQHRGLWDLLQARASLRSKS